MSGESSLHIGSVVVLSTSPPIARAFSDWAAGVGVRVLRTVTPDPSRPCNEGEMLRRIGDLDGADGLVCLLEGLSAGEEFLHRAEILSSSLPLVVLASGLDGLAGGAAPAAFTRAGIALVHSFDQMCDLIWALCRLPRPAGTRVGLVRIEPGWAGLAALTLARNGLALSAVELAAGPSDVAAMSLVQLDQDEIDVGVIMLAPPADGGWAEMTTTLSAGLVPRLPFAKPLCLVIIGGVGAALAREQLAAAGICVFSSLERASRALAGLAHYQAWLARPPRVVTRFPVNRRRAERILRRHQRQGGLNLEEYQVRQVLEAYGFQVPDGKLVNSVDQAIEAAERLGFPVALKLISGGGLDKSAVWGVRPDLNGPEAVRDAYDLIMLRVRERHPDARVTGQYVEQQRGFGIQTAIGMRRDPEFGPMLSFGLGGTTAEVLGERSYHPAPITAGEALELLRSSQAFVRLAAEDRDHLVDVSAIAEGLQRLSQLVTDFPIIREMEIRPFWVGGPGREPLAEGARLSLIAGDDHGRR